MQITVMSQNLGRGGWKHTDGAIEDRWPQLAEAINAVRPDILLGQEAEGWSADGHDRLVQAETDLDMDGILAPSPSGLGPVTLYRRDTMGRRTYANHDFSEHETHHGFQTIGFDVPCLPAKLAVGSVHLTPYAPVRAASEVSFIGRRVLRPGGGYAISGTPAGSFGAHPPLTQGRAVRRPSTPPSRPACGPSSLRATAALGIGRGRAHRYSQRLSREIRSVSMVKTKPWWSDAPGDRSSSR